MFTTLPTFDELYELAENVPLVDDSEHADIIRALLALLPQQLEPEYVEELGLFADVYYAYGYVHAELHPEECAEEDM